MQHLEGGIIARLHVRDGDAVAEGAPLLTLMGVGARADVDARADRRLTRLAERARLEAEILDRGAIAFPPELDAADPMVRAVVEAERRTFEARCEMVATRKRVLGQRIEQLRAQAAGFEAQRRSASEQLALIEEEIADKAALLDKGLMPKDELLRLRRAAAGIRGRRGEREAAVAQARQGIGEAELDLLAIDAERSERVATRAGELRGTGPTWRSCSPRRHARGGAAQRAGRNRAVARGQPRRAEPHGDRSAG